MNILVSVRLVGITRDLTGQSEVSVRVTKNARVRDVLNQKNRTYPELSGIKSLLVAVNGKYAEDEQPVDRDDEIALIPPVSGGLIQFHGLRNQHILFMRTLLATGRIQDQSISS